MAVVQNDDKVWFDSTNKLRAIGNEVQTEINNGSNVLVLSHFPTKLSELRRLLDERKIKFVEFSLYDSFRFCAATAGTVWLGLARGFQAPPSTSQLNSQLAPLRILVAEHHPRQSRDLELLKAAAALPCESQLCFYFSLDDPLMDQFAGAAIQKLLQQLGMDETECITHPLVTAAIRNAQEKIEEQVPRDVPAESIEDWFKYNLPEKKE